MRHQLMFLFPTLYPSPISPSQVAHTCFNTLNLPVYADGDALHEKLLIAIREAGEGFGLV